MSCGEFCRAFPDPTQVPVHIAQSAVPTCQRTLGHEPPHRAELPRMRDDDPYMLPMVLEWEDPPQFVAVLRELEREHGKDAIRMWVERADGDGRRSVPSVQGPWLKPPLPNWGPAREPVVVQDLDEFRRVYGPAPKGPNYERVAAVFSQDTEELEPVKRLSGGLILEPVPGGWRGWWRRARWWPLDTWDRWRERRAEDHLR